MDNGISDLQNKISNHSDLIAYNKKFVIHPDIANLIWIGDGPYKNYSIEKEEMELSKFSHLYMTIIKTGQIEPSSIFTSMQIKFPKIEEEVERPSYFPKYSTLLPEQRGIYLNYLANPYNSGVNIGYVFLFYYGLERHLLLGKIEEAFNVILKLRDIFSNKSFQSYSARALILSAMIRERGDLIVNFIESLDKDYEYDFDANLLLICFFSLAHSNLKCE